MPFRPEVGLRLTIDDMAFTVAEHPAAPGIPYGQEGRQGIVYALRDGGATPTVALKVFKSHYRSPYLADLAVKLAPYADFPGLRVCERTVLLPQKHTALLEEHPDLIYSMLMPWIPGWTWMEVVLERRALTPADSLRLARAFVELLTGMEQRGMAHGDLSAPNLLLPGLEEGGQPKADAPVALVDVEQMYAPGMAKPPLLPGGSPGYAHRALNADVWSAEMDRFAGAVLISEMLVWCVEPARQAAWQESYFAPDELQQETERYTVLTAEMAKLWGRPVVRLLEQAWRSEALRGCPTFGEWMVALSPLSAPVQEDSQVGALLMRARRLRKGGRADEALAQYRRLTERIPAGSPMLAEVQSAVAELEAELAAARDSAPQIPTEGGDETFMVRPGTGVPSPAAPVPAPAPASPEGAAPRSSRRWLWLGAGIGAGLLALIVLAVVVGLFFRWRDTTTPTAVAGLPTPSATPTVTEAGISPTLPPTATSAAAAATPDLTATAEAMEAAAADRLATATALAEAEAEDEMTPTEADDDEPAATAAATIEVEETEDAEVSPTPSPTVETEEAADTPAPQPSLSGKLAFSLAQGTSYKSYVVLVAPDPPLDLYADLGNARQPALSYDGKSLLFNGTGGGLDAIGIAASDGADPRAATCLESTGESGRPVWAPDNNRFAFDGLGADPANPPIYIQTVGEIDCDLVDNRLQIGGGFPIDANGLYPLWGPDNRIYFRSCATWDPTGGSQCGVWSVNPDGSDVVRLVDDPNFLPTSVSANRLLLMSSKDGNWEVYSVSLQGGTPQNVTNQPTTEVWGTLSPDGRTMAYLSNQAAGWAIWLANADGSNARAWLPIRSEWGEVDPNRIFQERMSWSK
jgi:hypothetical protein